MDSELSNWLTEVASWLRACPVEEVREYATDFDQAIAKAKELERAAHQTTGSDL